MGVGSVSGAASALSTCPGCGLSAPAAGGPVPEDHVASAECWAAYGRLLACSYRDPDRRAVHQMIVDAYAAQHAGGTSRRQVQTVALCLMTLCLFIEDDVDPARGPALHKQMVARRPEFTWLAPPPLAGLMTVVDPLGAGDAAAYRRLVREWGRQIWQAWTAHHPTVRAWNTHVLDPLP